MLRLLAAEAARRFGARTAFDTGTSRLSFADLDRLSDRVAAGFAHRGVRMGDLVALVLPDGPEFPICHLAAAKLGAVTAALTCDHPRLVETIERLDPALVVTVAAHAPIGAGRDAVILSPAARRREYGGETLRAALRDEPPPPPLPPDPLRPVAVVFTSGTTGPPKPAVFANRQLAAIRANGAGTRWGGGDARLLSRPMAHVGVLTRLPVLLQTGRTSHIFAPWACARAAGVGPSYAQTRHPEAAHADAAHTAAGHGNASHGNAGHGNTGHTDEGRADAGHRDTGHREARHGEAGHGEAGHGEAGHGEAGHGETARGEPGRHPEAGHGATGHEEAGPRETGHGEARFDAVWVWRLLERERIGVLQGTPAQLAALASAAREAAVDARSFLRLVLCAGAPAPAALIRMLRERFGVPVCNRYLCTEAGLGLGTGPDDPVRDAEETVGRPRPGIDVDVRDAGGRPLTDEEMDRGEVGEVLLRSQAVMSGYFRDPAGDARVFARDGFVRTGDRGFVDRLGRLHLVGRTSARNTQ